MPTREPAQATLRDGRTAVPGQPVDWSVLAHGGDGTDGTGPLYDEPRRPRGAPAAPGSGYFQHAAHSSGFLAELVKAHSADFRTLGRLTAWTAAGPTDPGPGDYRVLGWTSSAVLRWTLSRRLDSLNPVAAFRLLDQPEIASLDRSNRDYVVLAGADAGERPQGSISARDIDLWRAPLPAELSDAFAVDFDTYHDRFAGTEVAAA